MPSIPADTVATLSVRPKNGLAAGTYTETLTVTGNNGVTCTATLSFTVNTPTPTPTPGSGFEITLSAEELGELAEAGRAWRADLPDGGAIALSVDTVAELAEQGEAVTIRVTPVDEEDLAV